MGKVKRDEKEAWRCQRKRSPQHHSTKKIKVGSTRSCSEAACWSKYSWSSGLFYAVTNNSSVRGIKEKVIGHNIVHFYTYIQLYNPYFTYCMFPPIVKLS